MQTEQRLGHMSKDTLSSTEHCMISVGGRRVILLKDLLSSTFLSSSSQIIRSLVISELVSTELTQSMGLPTLCRVLACIGPFTTDKKAPAVILFWFIVAQEQMAFMLCIIDNEGARTLQECSTLGDCTEPEAALRA